MATPKKKHLIELMIEAGVKWPEGAEYAAQDKCDLHVWFFNSKPKVYAGETHHCAPLGPLGHSRLLPSICRNWHQTIVTREQYAEADAAANTSGKTNQVRESEDVPSSQPAAQLYSGVAGVMPSESIESLLSEIKAKREERDALVVKTKALALEVANIEQQVSDKLKEYGFAMSPVAASSKPEQPEITDWRDLRVGDVIKCDKFDSEYQSNRQIELMSSECVVTEINPVRIEVSSKAATGSNDGWNLNGVIGCEWHFIRRP